MTKVMDIESVAEWAVYSFIEGDMTIEEAYGSALFFLDDDEEDPFIEVPTVEEVKAYIVGTYVQAHAEHMERIRRTNVGDPVGDLLKACHA